MTISGRFFLNSYKYIGKYSVGQFAGSKGKVLKTQLTTLNMYFGMLCNRKQRLKKNEN